MTVDDRPLYLPDDLEERWAGLGLQQQIIRQHWADNVGRMTWPQRRRVRALLGGPITKSAGCGDLGELLAEDAVAVAEAELRARYDAAAWRAICRVADKAAASSSPGRPSYLRLLTWAAGCYDRGEILT